jgi:hypothetical protein
VIGPCFIACPVVAALPTPRRSRGCGRRSQVALGSHLRQRGLRCYQQLDEGARRTRERLRVRVATVGDGGQRSNTKAGLSAGRCSSIVKTSPARLMAPEASTTVDDWDTVTSQGHRGPGERCEREPGPPNGDGKTVPQVPRQVRLAQYLQSDPALQIPPHPFRPERLELPNQRRPVTRMDTATLDRPSATTPTQQPDPTPPAQRELGRRRSRQPDAA